MLDAKEDQLHMFGTRLSPQREKLLFLWKEAP
jgi:hypothetical protein